MTRIGRFALFNDFFQLWVPRVVQRALAWVFAFPTKRPHHCTVKAVGYKLTAVDSSPFLTTDNSLLRLFR